MIQAVSLKRNIGLPGTFILLAMLFLQAADAGYPPIYDVEIIVFLNNKNNTSVENTNINGAKKLPVSERAFPEGEFTELAYKFYQLKNISESLEESSDYNVLLHRAWRQLAYDSSNSVPYPLESMVNSQSKSIAGSVKLEMEHDLYLDIDVLLMSSKIPDDSLPKRPIQQLIRKQRVDGDHVYYFHHPHLSMIAKVTPYRKNLNEETRGEEMISFLR